MSEMIENAAIALHADVCKMLGVRKEPTAMWKDSDADFREHYRKRARVVIEAMRVPTNAMAEAAQGYTISNDSRQAVWAWEAMIDEALRE